MISMWFLRKKIFRQLGIEINETRLSITYCEADRKELHFKQFTESRKAKNESDVGWEKEAANKVFAYVKENRWEGVPAITTINHHQLVIRNLEFPPMSTEELREAMKWEVNQHIPYDGDEAVVDWFRLPSYKKEEQQKNLILLAAIPKNIVRAHQELFRECGVSLSGIDVIPAAISRFASCHCKLHCESKDICAILHVTSKNAYFIVLQQGQLHFTRTLAYGKLHIAEEENSRAFSDELSRTVEYYQNTYQEKIQALCLSGDVFVDEDHCGTNAKTLLNRLQLFEGGIEGLLLPSHEHAVSTGLAIKGVI